VVARAPPPVSEAVNAHENIYIDAGKVAFSLCLSVFLFLSFCFLLPRSSFPRSSPRAPFVFYPLCWLVSSSSSSSSSFSFCTFAIRFPLLLSATLLFRVARRSSPQQTTVTTHRLIN